MLEAVGLDGPGRAAPEDRSDPGFLGAGEHGRAIVAEGHQVGQPSPTLDKTDTTQKSPPPRLMLLAEV
jgi:hypothetical protein